MFKPQGVEPHWLSDGGGEVGVYPTHDYESKKKIKKKKIKLFGQYQLYTYL